MRYKTLLLKALIINVLFLAFYFEVFAENGVPKFKVIGFYTSRFDQAHISYVHEANLWFKKASLEHNFEYDSTDNWDNMNDQFLENYQVILFLDTRPDSLDQRAAFQRFMDSGGAWMGFHFAAFALTPSTYPQNWDWYHNEFLGSGEYKGNTWRPTSALLRVENAKHSSTKGLPPTFKSAPNEWYSWQKNLKDNPQINVLLSIDPTSFPLGTGPKAHEIWHEGYYPVAWTNKKYKMIYINMGHNDIDYENKTNKTLSFTFDNTNQNQFIINSLLWLGDKDE